MTPSMSDYTREAYGIVLLFENGHATLRDLLGPQRVEGGCSSTTVLLEIMQEERPTIFVGRMYNILRRLEAGVYKYRKPLGFLRAVREFISTIRDIIEQKKACKLVARDDLLATYQRVSMLKRTMEAMKIKLATEDVDSLSHDELVERARLLSEFLQERVGWGESILNDSIPEWLGLPK